MKWGDINQFEFYAMQYNKMSLSFISTNKFLLNLSKIDHEVCYLFLLSEKVLTERIVQYLYNNNHLKFIENVLNLFKNEMKNKISYILNTRILLNGVKYKEYITLHQSLIFSIILQLVNFYFLMKRQFNAQVDLEEKSNKMSKGVDTMNLNEDLIFEIIKYLDYDDVFNLSYTNKENWKSVKNILKDHSFHRLNLTEEAIFIPKVMYIYNIIKWMFRNI